MTWINGFAFELQDARKTYIPISRDLLLAIDKEFTREDASLPEEHVLINHQYAIDKGLV